MIQMVWLATTFSDHCNPAIIHGIFTTQALALKAINIDGHIERGNKTISENGGEIISICCDSRVIAQVFSMELDKAQRVEV